MREESLEDIAGLRGEQNVNNTRITRRRKALLTLTVVCELQCNFSFSADLKRCISR